MVTELLDRGPYGRCLVPLFVVLAGGRAAQPHPGVRNVGKSLGGGEDAVQRGDRAAWDVVAAAESEQGVLPAGLKFGEQVSLSAVNASV